MPQSPLSERFKQAFPPEATASFGNQYLEMLLQNLRETDKGIRYVTAAVIFLIFTFELFARAAVSEISLGPVKLSELSLIHRLLPALAAYFLFELVSLYDLRSRGAHVFYAGIAKFYPDVYATDLEAYLLPSSPTVFGDSRFLDSEHSTAKIQKFLNYVIATVLILGTLIFIASALYRLFGIFGRADPIVWISSVVSVVYAVQGFLVAESEMEVL
jgi:hypothetical protein